MKYEDFEKFIKEKCMYDTIYEDSDGRQILVVQMLDAYGMVDKALRARLAQPEERLFTEAQALDIAQKLFDSAALNAVPIGWVRKKEWVGLTDEDIQEIHYQIKAKGMGAYKTEDIYRAIEAKLKENNA